MNIPGTFSLLTICLGNQTLWSQQDTESMNARAAMAAWQAAETPTEARKRLDFEVGTWDRTLKSAVPPCRSMESKWSAEFRWILDGRVLEQEMKEEMMGMQMNGKVMSDMPPRTTCIQPSGSILPRL